MSLHVGSTKWSGSAASYLAYAEEEGIGSDEVHLKYHDRPEDGIVFTHVRGKATDHLPGLDLELGLTKEQHAELHQGAWDGVQYLKPGYAAQWELDDKGNPIEVVDTETGEKHKVPIINERTGKQLFLPVHTAGYDLSFTCSKDIVEHLIAHPEDIAVVQECLQLAVDKAMTVGVEEYAKIVRVPVRDPALRVPRMDRSQSSQTQRETADGLIWWSTFGTAARPTPESIARGYGADPLLHMHVFLSSMAWKDGRWLTIDGKDLMKTADYRRDVAEVELSRLLEERGIKIEYSDVDRKGRRHQTIEGSKPENRQFLSTNSNRRERIKVDYYKKYGRAMSRQELDLAMQVTKGAKTAAAKQADHGSLEQYELWRQAMGTAGFSVDMPARGVPVAYSKLTEQIAELHERLESAEGLNLFCDDSSMFPHDAVLKATMRAGMGLGLEPEILRTLAQDYIDKHLEVARDAAEPTARYYTTKTILANQDFIAKRLDQLDSQPAPAVRAEIVDSVIASQDKTLDGGQHAYVHAATSSRRVLNIIGHAGAGKTLPADVAAQCFREAHAYEARLAKEQGRKPPAPYEIVATAVAAKKAGEFARAIGADRGGSIKSLREQYKHGWRPDARTIIFVDEASLVGSFEMKDLLEISGDAKIVMIGDLKQGLAVNVSGWWSVELDKRLPVELPKVYRQADIGDRIMLDHLRNGRSQIALQMLHERNRIFTAERSEDMMTLVAERYGTWRDAGYDVEDVVVMHTGSNQELDQYNLAIQVWRELHGEVDRTQSYVVDETTTGRRWTLCVGDRIIFNKSVFDGLSEPVKNGLMGYVVQVRHDHRGGAVQVRLDDRRKVWVKLQPEMDVVPVALAYGLSTSKGQGAQFACVIASPGTPNITSQNSIYSQASRMVENLDVLVDKQRWGDDYMQSLAVAFSTPQEKVMASAAEYVNERQDEAPRRTYPDFEESLSVGVDLDEDGRAVAVLEPEEESQETAADVAQQYIDEIRQRMDYGEGFDMGL